MENRYLYKAKRIDNGKWVTGFYVKGSDMYGEEVHVIFETDAIFYSHGDLDGFAEINPATICQCTGLKDKNGELIWENDIVMEESNTAPIKFGMYGSHFDYGINNLGFYVNFAMDTYLRQDIGYWHKKVEVIGNIFDNPELFEGKNHDD